MSRQRFIYPEIWRSEQFLALSIPARLLFIGIFSTADDYGRRKASAASLKVEVFPIDNVGLDQVLTWRNEIAHQGMIRLYTDKSGVEILDIPSWAKFQNPRHLSPSRLAEYPGAGALKISAGEPPSVAGKPPSSAGGFPKTRHDDGSGVVWCGVDVNAGKDADASSPPLAGDTRGDVAGISKLAAGFLHTWKRRDTTDDFDSWDALWKAFVAFERRDPVTALAHLIEIDKSKRIKSKPATMLVRLKPKRGEKRRLPADKWMRAAEQLMNGPRGQGGDPATVGEVLGKNNGGK